MKLKTLLLTTTLLVSTVAFAGTPTASKKHNASAPTKKHNHNMFKDFYAKIEAGMSMPSQLKTDKRKCKFEKGFVGGVGAGYRFNEFFRTDLMLQYRQPKLKKQNWTKGNDKSSYSAKVKSFAAMFNGYLDAHNDTIFTPYAMAGLGIGFNKAKDSHTTNGKNDGNNKFKKQTNLIWNVGLGCQAKVYENISLDLGYRYANLGKIGKKKEINKKFKLKTHEILLGLTYDL